MATSCPLCMAKAFKDWPITSCILIFKCIEIWLIIMCRLRAWPLSHLFLARTFYYHAMLHVANAAWEREQRRPAALPTPWHLLPLCESLKACPRSGTLPVYNFYHQGCDSWVAWNKTQKLPQIYHMICCICPDTANLAGKLHDPEQLNVGFVTGKRALNSEDNTWMQLASTTSSEVFLAGICVVRRPQPTNGSEIEDYLPASLVAQSWGAPSQPIHWGIAVLPLQEDSTSLHGKQLFRLHWWMLTRHLSY